MADIVLIFVIFVLLRTTWILDDIRFDIRSDLREVARKLDKSEE